MMLTLHPDTYAVCRLDPTADMPFWAFSAQVVSVTRTAGELSVVCREDLAPPGVRAEKSWRCLEVVGPLDFSLVGVMAQLSDILARASISIFVVSTYDTDLIFVREEDVEEAIYVLSRSGHAVRRD